MRSRILTLVVALLFCGCSQEDTSAAKTPRAPDQEAPPPTASEPGDESPPDLSHVHVGQRYHFQLDQAGTKMEMIWEVKAIDPDAVRYTVSILKDGTPLSPPSETTWEIPKPKHHEPSTKPDQVPAPVYETLTLAGREWRCLVGTTGDVKTWTAVSGTLPTFPPLLKQTRGITVNSLLTKIEAPK